MSKNTDMSKFRFLSFFLVVLLQLFAFVMLLSAGVALLSPHTAYQDFDRTFTRSLRRTAFSLMCCVITLAVGVLFNMVVFVAIIWCCPDSVNPYPLGKVEKKEVVLADDQPSEPTTKAAEMFTKSMSTHYKYESNSSEHIGEAEHRDEPSDEAMQSDEAEHSIHAEGRDLAVQSIHAEDRGAAVQGIHAEDLDAILPRHAGGSETIAGSPTFRTIEGRLPGSIGFFVDDAKAGKQSYVDKGGRLETISNDRSERTVATYPEVTYPEGGVAGSPTFKTVGGSSIESDSYSVGDARTIEGSFEDSCELFLVEHYEEPESYYDMRPQDNPNRDQQGFFDATSHG